MKANELRIGNLVYHNDKIFQVDLRTFAEIHEGNVKLIPFLMKPIPLTEEWLLKFGFEQKGINIFILYKIILYCSKHRYYFKFPIEPSSIIIPYIEFGATYLSYVHQLQNLYYTLTNEELQIKK
jgi:hypothetical protein